LYKGYDFSLRELTAEREVSKPIKMLYAGNLYSGRYRTIKKLAKTIGKINSGEIKYQLSVYSATPLSNRQIKKINKAKGCAFYGRVTEKRVSELQKESDMVLHVEPFTLKGSLLCRLSFSTKLVDYFYNSKCIFAIGHKRCSSMQYLKNNNCAIVHTDLKEIEMSLLKILDDEEIITKYQQSAYNCGEKNHQISEIQKKIKENFEKSINQ
jgi:hypothetical protein